MNKIKKIKLVALVMFSLCIGLCCPIESKAKEINKENEGIVSCSEITEEDMSEIFAVICENDLCKL